MFSAEIALLGLVVGTLVGVSGVGAGVLTAPTLILLGIHPSVAIGTDLAYSAVTKLVGTVRNAAGRLVNRVWLGRMLIGSIPGTILGTEFPRLLPVGDVDGLLRTALAVVLIVSALAIATREVLAARGNIPRGMDLARSAPLAISAVGALVGFLVGLTSIGSGALFMLFMLACSSLSAREAVATDIANAAGLTLAAALLHLAGGSVNLGLAGNLLLGSVPGILCGGWLSRRVPARPLKIGIAALVLAGGVALVV